MSYYLQLFLFFIQKNLFFICIFNQLDWNKLPIKKKGINYIKLKALIVSFVYVNKKLDYIWFMVSRQLQVSSDVTSWEVITSLEGGILLFIWTWLVVKTKKRIINSNLAARVAGIICSGGERDLWPSTFINFSTKLI